MSSTQEAGDLFGEVGPAHAMARSPTVVIASIGLWGMNLYFFRIFRIDYVKVLKHDLIKFDGHSEETKKGPEPEHFRSTSAMSDYSADDDSYGTDEDLFDASTSEPPSSITWYRLVSLSMLLLFVLHSTYFIWIDLLNGGPVGAVFFFYGAVILTIACPLPSLLWLRKATVLVLQRTYELLNPRCTRLANPEKTPRPVPFVDVFFADALCSLSKVFFDWGILLHMAANPGPMQATTQTILIPSALAAVPYLIRARQCLVMYTVDRLKKDPKRYAHLANALKYSTSIFPLCLSAYSKTQGIEREKELEVYLVMLLAINAFYALYWDIVMDWGMMQNPASMVGCAVVDSEKNHSCTHGLLRSRLRFGVGMSALIMVADCILRFSWVLRWYSKTHFPSDDSFVLCTQFLEVFRRAIWNLLRVEWEHLKQSRQGGSDESSTVVPMPPEEMTAFLHPSPPKQVKKRIMGDEDRGTSDAKLREL